MGSLSLLIYLASVFQSILILSVITLIISFFIVVITTLFYIEGDCTVHTAMKFWKKSIIAAIISTAFIVIMPTKPTCFQIFGADIITNVIKNSEEIQKFPDKSFETINRFLNSIIPETKDKEIK